MLSESFPESSTYACIMKFFSAHSSSSSMNSGHIQVFDLFKLIFIQSEL